MNILRVALTSVVATAALLAGAMVAMAAPGQMTTNVNVRSGPDTGYAVVGVLRSGEMADVSQCANGWCYVRADSVDGWVSSSFIAAAPAPQQPGPRPQQDPSINLGINIDGNGKPSINFGVNQPPAPDYPQQPQRPPFPPRPPQMYPNQPYPPRPQPLPVPDQTAQACFYTGTNYTGASFCVDQGDTVNVLSRNWNDQIRSVDLDDGVTVDICSERNLVGLCQTLTRSRSRLSPQIDRAVSSVDVY